MKKKIIILLGVFLLILAAVCLFADFNTYENRTKTTPNEQEGLLFSISTFDGKNESEPFIACLGHAWLSLENRTGHAVHLKDYEIQNGEVLAFSVWALTDHQGVTFNLEPNFIRQYGRYVGRQSLTVPIDEAKLSVIEAYMKANDTWTFDMNCSHWSLGLWNEVVEEPYRLKNQTLLYTPTRVQKSFSEFDSVEFDKDFSNAGGVFFYQDEIRTEFQLCS